MSSSRTTRLTELSNIIAQKTAQLESYLASHSLPAPSFDVDAPEEFGPIALEDNDIRQARIELLDATKELRDLVTGPTDSVRYLAWNGNSDSLGLLAIYHFKIASAFPANAFITYPELSARTGLSERNLRRICRHAMTNHVFTENPKGSLRHTRASRLIAEDEQIQSWIGLHLEDLWKPAAHTVEAMDKWPGSEEPIHTGIQTAYLTEEHWFQYLAKDPERLRRFGIGMKSFSEGAGYEVEYLANHYPWETFGDGTVVDVGGGIGFTSVILARAHSSLKFVNQDLPAVLRGGGAAAIPEDLRDRLSFMAYDFFKPQPVKDADAYLFRWIFHGWSDEYGARILRSQIPALKKGARIIINEWVLPNPGDGSQWDEKFIRTMDLLMLTVVNSNERDLDDWRELFRKADKRYRFIGASRPKGCQMWIIEAVWDPDNAFAEVLPVADTL